MFLFSLQFLIPNYYSSLQNCCRRPLHTSVGGGPLAGLFAGNFDACYNHARIRPPNGMLSIHMVNDASGEVTE